ncbi:MAG: adenine-specific DNA methylase [Thaumarchaeota archaeon]|nr:adenine-specific DNA methylase [Nitrososphaerota archaeon]
MSRVCAMPNHKTFEIKPIKELIKQERIAGVEIDLFPFPYEVDRDALKYLRSIITSTVFYLLYDPPYSQRQLFEMYLKLGVNLQSNAAYFKELDFEIDRVMAPKGKVIKFGWNSKRISKQFDIIRILLVNHGAAHNDTIVTVQQKNQGTL